MRKQIITAFFACCIVQALLVPLALAADNINSGKKTITGFDVINTEIERIKFSTGEKPDIHNIIKYLPECLTVYLQGESGTSEIPVTWFCISGDYAETEYYYYQFSPKWDDNRYSLNAGLDIYTDVPYVAVVFADDVASLQSVTGSSYETAVFNYLVNNIGLNEAAACGVMANIESESVFNPINLENKYESILGFSDTSYTAAVDNGSYNNFVYDSAGYGLCQWTYWSRKQGLLNFARSRGVSIGNFEMQMAYLQNEMSGNLMNYLLSVSNDANGAYNAASYFCINFENPANASTRAIERGNNAKNHYWPEYTGEHIHQVIKKGSTGTCVRELQTALNRFRSEGWLTWDGDMLDVDGNFGPATEVALKAFQASQNIEVDGVCGSITWGYIENPFRPNPHVDVGTDFYAYIINTTSWLHLANDGDGNVTARTGDVDN